MGKKQRFSGFKSPLFENLSPEEQQEIENSILQGAVDRSVVLSISWVILSVAFGISSLPIFRIARPELTLWENLWPRFLLNAIPCLIQALILFKWKISINKKIYLVIFSFPLLLVLASCINAWPIFFTTHPNLYLYFHGTNAIVFASTVFFIFGSPKMILTQIAAFTGFFLGPLIYFFSRNNLNILNLIISDFSLLSFALWLGGSYIHKLRLRLAAEEIHRRKKLTPFLGATLTEAFYHSPSMEINGYTQEGVILSIDLRGYTNFVHQNDPTHVKEFMSSYHNYVAKVLGELQGYLHKTSGDGVLCSFGIMEKEADLHDLPDIEMEMQAASLRRKDYHFNKAVKAFEGILREFERMRNELAGGRYKNSPLVVGAGVAFGEVEVLVRGNAHFRQELDIDGEAIVRAVRLEAYTKYLNHTIDLQSSFLVVSPELKDVSNQIIGVKTFPIPPDAPVRDYPHIREVLYRRWKHQRLRGETGSENPPSQKDPKAA